MGGSACLTAKEKLLDAGIALVVKVKPSLLKRLARVCETKVYKSLAQVMDFSLYICTHMHTHAHTPTQRLTDIYTEIEGQAEPAQAADESLRD